MTPFKDFICPIDLTLKFHILHEHEWLKKKQSYETPGIGVGGSHELNHPRV